MLIFSNVFSFSAVLFFAVSTLVKKERYYLFQTGNAICMVIALFLSGSYTGAALAVMTTLFNLFCMKDKQSINIFAMMTSIAFLILCITFKQPVDIISFIAFTEGIAVKVFLKKYRNIQLGMGINSLLYLTTDSYFKLVPNAIFDIVLFIMALRAWTSLRQKEKVPQS